MNRQLPINTHPLLNQGSIQGILFGLSAFGAWCLNDTCTKFIGKAHVPFLQMICLFCIGAIGFLITSSALRGNIQALMPHNIKLQLYQGIITLFQSLVCVITFTQLPLTTVYSALFASPMIISVLAMWLYKEQLGSRQFFYIALGFCGAILAVNPFSADLSGGSALGWMLLPFYPLLFSSSTLIIRKLRLTDTSESIALFPSAFRIIIFWPIAIAYWEPMEFAHILLCLLAGCFLGLGNLLFNAALARTDSAIVAPTHYSQLIWGALFGFVFWQDLPAWHCYVGSAIILVAGLAGARIAYSRNKNEAVVATA